MGDNTQCRAQIINLHTSSDHAPSSNASVGLFIQGKEGRVAMSTSSKDALHRIKEELDLQTDNDLADLFGVTLRRIQNWKHRKQTPTEQISAICSEHGLDLNYILTGDNSPLRHLKESPQESTIIDNLNSPRPSFVSCLCGQPRICPPYKRYDRRNQNGDLIESFESSQIVDVLSVGTNWLTHSLGIEPQNLLLIKNIGDNMTPYLQDGDLVIVDTSIKNTINGGCVVLRYADGIMMVRRVFRNSDGTVLAKCDTECCEPDIVDPNNNEVYPIIVGRVVRRIVR